MRLAVHEMDAEHLLWRLEAVPDTGQGRGTDGPGLPMIMVGRTGAVLYMNEAARTLLGGRAKGLDAKGHQRGFERSDDGGDPFQRQALETFDL